MEKSARLVEEADAARSLPQINKFRAENSQMVQAAVKKAKQEAKEEAERIRIEGSSSSRSKWKRCQTCECRKGGDDGCCLYCSLIKGCTCTGCSFRNGKLHGDVTKSGKQALKDHQGLRVKMMEAETLFQSATKAVQTASIMEHIPSILPDRAGSPWDYKINVGNHFVPCCMEGFLQFYNISER